MDYHTDSEEGEVYTVFDNQEDPIERHARAWRQFTKQQPRRKPRSIHCQYPVYQQPESEDEQPNWIKQNRESYSSGEEEAFFRIPDQTHRTMFVGPSSSTKGKSPSAYYQLDDPRPKNTLKERMAMYNQYSDCDLEPSFIKQQFEEDELEEDRIEEAKRRYWGVDWRKCDKFDPRPRLFWTANMLTPEEYHRQKQANTVPRYLVASGEEQDLYWKNYYRARDGNPLLPTAEEMVRRPDPRQKTPASTYQYTQDRINLAKQLYWGKEW
jgi:hypothetical protein